MKTAVDAQLSIEQMVKEQEQFFLAQEEGHQPTQEELVKQAEMERIITGKFLATAWATTKFEVTDILRKVCHNVLRDKTISRRNELLEQKHCCISVKRCRKLKGPLKRKKKQEYLRK